MKTRILLMSAFLTGIPTEKNLRNVIFPFAVKISVRKTVGIRNLPEIRPQFKSEKQSALPTRHVLIKQHKLFCLVRKKGLDRFVNHIETRPPVIR